APGKGSTFRVLMPALAVAQIRQKVAAQRHDLSGAGTVLVVDDEEIVRRIAKNTLESWGYRVLLAENGQVALERFPQKGDEIALVLLDLTMPVMNGEQAFQRLKQIKPRVKVILTSGYDEADAMGRFAGDGLAGFLQKPYTAKRLAERVKRVLDPVGT